MVRYQFWVKQSFLNAIHSQHHSDQNTSRNFDIARLEKVFVPMKVSIIWKMSDTSINQIKKIFRCFTQVIFYFKNNYSLILKSRPFWKWNKFAATFTWALPETHWKGGSEQPQNLSWIGYLCPRHTVRNSKNVLCPKNCYFDPYISLSKPCI